MRGLLAVIALSWCLARDHTASFQESLSIELRRHKEPLTCHSYLNTDLCSKLKPYAAVRLITIASTSNAEDQIHQGIIKSRCLSSNLLETFFQCLNERAVAVCRQESFFHYLFGVEEEDYMGIVDIKSGETILLMPRLPQAYAVWMGEIQVFLNALKQWERQGVHMFAICLWPITV